MVASADAEAALVELAALWRRERAASAARFAEERAKKTLAERVERGVALRELALAEVDAAPGGRALLWLEPEVPAPLDDLRLGPGDPVVLHGGDPTDRAAVRGVVARRGARRIAVMIDGDPPEWIEQGRCHLDADDPTVTFDRGDRAIGRFAAAKPSDPIGRLRGVLYGGQAAEADHRDGRGAPLVPLDAALDEPQLVAVRRAVAARDVALVHGPPGTGKTRVLVEIIRQRLARGETVLATAASNAAVDHLASRLLAAGVDALRLGHPARVSDALEGATLDAALHRDDHTRLARGWLDQARELRRRATARRGRSGDREAIRALYQEARELEQHARRDLRLAQERILDRAQVLCATCTGTDGAVLGARRFDVAVVDEATQVVDPLLLIPLGRATTAILAGDPRQLPPTVLDRDAARAGLGVTLFERLAAADPDLPQLLVTQHRMHRSIMAFPSASMYGGRLVAAAEVAEHTLEDLGVAPDPLRPGPLVFVDTSGTGWSDERADDDPSTHNPGSAARTAAEVRRLASRGLAVADVAVITPYDAQVRHLRERLAAERAAGLEIDTVDGFQGREKEAVVVDLVRSNDDGEIGFLADTRRMNVALTRARRFLLVIGDAATLAGHPYYAGFLAAVEREGLYLSAWADDAPPLAPYDRR